MTNDNSRIADLSFLIVGTVRNCQSTITSEVRHLNQVFVGAAQVRWLLVESDSDDNTLDCLSSLKTEVGLFDYLAMGRLKDQFPERARRIAVCRDAYVKEIQRRPEYSEVDYVVVADLDGMCRDLTAESVESCWSRNDWLACFGNQPKGYYDLWALRHESWSPKDPFRTYRELVTLGVKPAIAYKTSVIDKILKIETNIPWIAVESAFGGLGIYRIEAFKHADYSVDGEYPADTCEHTTFNRKLGVSSSKLYINPSLVNIQYSNHVTQLKLKYFLMRVFGMSFFEKLKLLSKFFR
ncbi:hypothetical protein OAC11_05085 [Alphaproteobacteria bacterium]|nr:hypothetical protein [Alphaproteobacteria bacterium]